MHYFGNLSEKERALFLSVISPKTKTQKRTKKRNCELPKEFSEDSFYNDLVKNHNSKVEMRLAKMNNK